MNQPIPAVMRSVTNEKTIFWIVFSIVMTVPLLRGKGFLGEELNVLLRVKTGLDIFPLFG
jgi:hypothetical protein